MNSKVDIHEMVSRAFEKGGISPKHIEVRSFPGEVIVIVTVVDNYYEALSIAQEIDKEITEGFVTVRKSESKSSSKKYKPVKTVRDDRVAELIELLTARSRTSESQPSLRYVADVKERINLAVSPRHHLIFGRRGVGKTALLLETKQRLESKGYYTLWVNMHPLRQLDGIAAFLTVALRICDLGLGALQGSNSSNPGIRILERCQNQLNSIFYGNEAETDKKMARIVPLMQQGLSRFCLETGKSIYLFLDDVHYLSPQEVPVFLDLLHGTTRDCPAWLKVAGIQHQTRWFVSNPPTGLQTGHDADLVSLDVTLEQPERAKKFLLDVLRGYLDECEANPVSGFLGGAAIDRLVLASGGVPRDFLTLTATSLQTARGRANARIVRVQDVNNAAGEAASVKLQELEDDAAAVQGQADALINGLTRLRNFLLQEEQITYFRIDFQDKEKHPKEYGLIQLLADLRMLHLINASLSDPHQAGRRSEVFLMDLSQYSGSRLKQGLQVLDFERGHIVLKRTRSKEPKKTGENARKLMGLLRRGPLFELSKFSDLAYFDD